MKNILVRQMFVIPVLYVITKTLWDLIPVEVLPIQLQTVVNDIFGHPFLMAMILLLFIFILWKIPVLEILAQFLFGTKPNIQGTWMGRLKYEWEGKKIEKPAFLVIKQVDGYSLNIQLITDERISSSIYADIVPCNGGKRILYTYSNEESPNNKEKNPSHEGFCQLDIDDVSNILQGIYYTSRKTFGELNFDKKNKKIVMNFEKAKRLFGI